jgi:rubrerythrin
LFSTVEILDIAIGIEQNGEAVYRDALEIISEPRLVDLLTWMADEEVKHSKWFSDLKQNVATESANPFVEEMGQSICGRNGSRAVQRSVGRKEFLP